MMKKVFSILLMLVLCLGLTVTANAADTPKEHKHGLNSGADLTWNPIGKLSEITAPGNYCIDGSLTLGYYDRAINASGTVNLCLNGASVDYSYAVTVEEGTTLNICDCGTSSIAFPLINKGTTNIYGGVFAKQIENEGTLTIYDGSYVTSEYAGSIHNNGGTLTIHDGTFQNTSGHAVENDGGEITIYDGSFEGKKCCVFNNDGTLTIHKGTFVSNGSYATIDVYGGSATIKNGTYQNGAPFVLRITSSGNSLIVEDGTFTGSGDVACGNAGTLDIRGGTFTTTGREKNVLLAYKKVAVSGGIFNSGSQAWIKRGENGSFQLSGGTFKGGLRLNLEKPSAGGPVLPESLAEGYAYYQNGQIYRFTEGVNRQIIKNGDVIVKKEPSFYTVTYNSGEYGREEQASDTKTEGKDLTLQGEIFSRTGYKQTGWATKDGKVYDLDSKYTTDADVILYPVWTINRYTITFDTDGGSEILPITQDYATAVTKPADPKKEGWTFTGWDKEIPSTMPAESVTITAQWAVKPYTITFDTDGGSEIKAITLDFGAAVTAPADPIKTGYTFAGWDKEIPATMPAGGMTITAQWTINRYTITFDTDGGSEVEAITQDYGSEVTAPEEPAKTGYAFVGWADETGNIVVFPLNMPLDGMQLTAVWERIPAPDLPQTGDSSALGLWMLLTGLTGAALLAPKRRKN